MSKTSIHRHVAEHELMKEKGIANFLGGATFKDIAEFERFGGAAKFGVGPLWIGKEEYWSDSKTFELTSATAIKDQQLWPEKGYNFSCKGSDDWNGSATFLYGYFTSTELGGWELGTYNFTNLFDLTTLLDDAGVVLGTVVLSVVRAGSESVLLMEILQSSSSKSFIYRSIDGGANWGSDANATNKLPVNLVGFDGTTHLASVSTLGGQALQQVTLNGKDALLLGWYSVITSEFNRLMLQVSYDAGLTWTTLFNTTTLGRHIHVIRQDTFTNDIFIGLGDKTEHSGIIKWDGTTKFPSGDFTYSDLSAGFFTWSNSVKFRPLAFWITEKYVYWTSDNSVAAGDDNRGIFRTLKTSDTTEKVTGINVISDDTAGGYGVTAKSGAWYCIDFPEGGETDLTKNVYASFDHGETWKIIGKVELETTGNAAQSMLIGMAGDSLWISHDGIAGAAVRTYSFTEVEGIIDQPDQLAPVVWVDNSNVNAADTVVAVGAANNLPQGSTPDYPIATLRYTVIGSHITYGERVVIAGDVEETVATTLPVWTAHGRGAVAGRPVQVTAVSQFNWRSGAAIAYLFYANTGDIPIRFHNVDMDAAGNNPIIDGSAAGTSLIEIVDAQVGKGKLSSNGINARGSLIRLLRSILWGGTASALYVKDTALEPEILMSAIVGGATGVLSERTTESSAIIENSIITGQTTSLKNTAGTAVPFNVKNSFISGTTSIQHGTSVTYSDADIDYSVIDGTEVSVGGTINSNGLTFDAGMIPLRSVSDFGANSASLLTMGTTRTLAGDLDINKLSIETNVIGVSVK